MKNSLMCIVLMHCKLLVAYQMEEKNTTYQGVDACSYRIQDKDKEHLIIGMANTVIYPHTVVILHVSDDKLIRAIHI